MKNALRYIGLAGAGCCILLVAIWILANTQSNQRLQEQALWQALQNPIEPAMKPRSGNDVPVDRAAESDNAAYWLTQLPENGTIQLAQYLHIDLPEDSLPIMGRLRVMDNPTSLSLEQRGAILQFIEDNPDLLEIIDRLGQSVRFDALDDNAFVATGLGTARDLCRVLLGASAILGLEGDADRAADFWLRAMRANHSLYAYTDNPIGFHISQETLRLAANASVWFMADPGLDRSLLEAALPLLDTGPMPERMRGAVWRYFQENAQERLSFIDGTAPEIASSSIPIWEFLAKRSAMILVSPLLKQELATECSNMEKAMLTVQGAPWTWESARSESESQRKKHFMLLGLSAYDDVYHFMNLTQSSMITMDTMRLALAAILWRRDHGGHLPASPDALVPDYLPALPRDSRTGGPFSILETDGRLIIHSHRLNVEDPDGRDDWRVSRSFTLWAERTPATTPAERYLSLP